MSDVRQTHFDLSTNSNDEVGWEERWTEDGGEASFCESMEGCGSGDTHWHITVQRVNKSKKTKTEAPAKSSSAAGAAGAKK